MFSERSRFIAIGSATLTALAFSIPASVQAAEFVGAYTTAGSHFSPGAPAEQDNQFSDTTSVANAASHYAVNSPESQQYPTRLVTADARARADLTTGSVGAEGSSSSWGYSNSLALWDADVLIKNANVASNEAWDLGVLIGYHGEFEGLGGSAGSTLRFTMSGPPVVGYSHLSDYQISSSFSPNHATVSNFNGGPTGNLFTVSSISGLGTNDQSVRLSRTVVGKEFVMNLRMELRTNTQDAATASFFNTANFRFDIPSGVTYSTASGNFLSAITPAVPEPTTWALMIVGFGLVGGAMRSSRARTREIVVTN